MLDPDGKPVVKMMSRAIGDTGLDALSQVCLVGPYIKQSTYGGTLWSAPEALSLLLADTVGEIIDWVGIAITGRFILLSHKKDATDGRQSAGGTWLYDVPWKAWRNYPNGLGFAVDRHTIDLPESKYPQEYKGTFQRGDRFTRCKSAGIRDFAWLHSDPLVAEATDYIDMTGETTPNDWTASAGTKIAAVEYGGTDDDDATYIRSTADAQSQTFNCVTTTIGLLEEIIQVELVVRGRHEGVAGKTFATVILGSDESVLDTITFSAGHADTSVVVPHPAGRTWTPEDIRDIQVKLTSADANPVRITSLYFNVTHRSLGTRDGAMRFLGHADPSNITKHSPGNLFRVRLRLVNYTTGFVGPISQHLQLAIGDNGEGVKLSWAPGTHHTLAATAGAVNIGDTGAELEPMGPLLRSVFGVDVPDSDGPLTGTRTYTGLITPTIIAQEGAYDVRLQVWVTQSVPSDNPSGGGGYYFLDQEIPVVHRCVSRLADPLFGGSTEDNILWPGWIGDEHLGSAFIGRKVPYQSNDELISSEVYLPGSDDVGALEPSEALGLVGGALISLGDGGSLTTDPFDVGSGDIRSSPPWKFYPGGWIEAVAPLYRHRVQPQGKNPPKFVNVGDILFFVGQNKIVRIVRDGSAILADDIDLSGGVNRDGVTGVGSSVIVVTSSGVEEINPVTMKMQTLRIVQRVISEKWHSYARQGQIMSGFDPQLKALFIAPRRAATSTDWLRSEALIVWLGTGRVTMLADVYWCAMSRGVHPITGKEHLFFIDPAMNITYPDDLLDDDSPATMVGVNAASDPTWKATGWVHSYVTYTIQVTGLTFDADAAIIVEGMPLQEGATDGWDKTAGVPDVDSIATSIAASITQFMADMTNHHVTSVNAVTDTVTIVCSLRGVMADDWQPFVALLNIDSNMILTQTVAGETTDSGAPLEAGGAYQGAVTDVSSGGGETTITDDTLDAADGGKNFDLYAWYNPHNEDALGIQPTRPALVGAQVYFLRNVVDGDGDTRPTLVADARVKSNTQQELVFNDSEINYHNGATAILEDDQYTVSPVVFQVVGAPVDAGDFVGSGIDNAIEIETLSVLIGERKGAAAENGGRLPAAAPTQGSLFFGAATRADLQGRELGKVVAPSTQIGKVTRLAEIGEAPSLFWDEETPEPLTERIGARGNSLFPVITCYGADYQFALHNITGKVLRSGSTLGTEPEGN
jgi:hypothetical protein